MIREVCKMVREILLQTLDGVWPMLFIFVTILASIRIVYLVIHHEKIILYKELLMLLFVVYILCLFEIVTFQDVNFGQSNFVPFREILRYKSFNTLFLKNVVGNVVMFLPYGFFAAYYLKTKKPLVILLLATIASFAIEATQLFIGRVFDIDDIILNVAGGLFGFLLYVIFDEVVKHLPKALKKPIVSNIIVIVLFVLLILYLFYTLGGGLTL